MLSNKTLQLNRVQYELQYNSYNGVFFVYNPKTCRCINIHDCREIFSWGFRNSHSLIGFQSSCVDIKTFNDFWEKIEDRLNLQQKSVIHYLDTPAKGMAFVIELSPFWLENVMRKSLLTLLIRCGANYYNGNFQQAINNYQLANMTSNAIELFLQGYTQPTFKKFSCGGFVSKFCHRTETEALKFLIKP